MHTYIHTYIQTYIHIHTCICKKFICSSVYYEHECAYILNFYIGPNVLHEGELYYG